MNKLSEGVFYFSIAAASFIGAGRGMDNAADARSAREGAKAAADQYSDAAVEAAQDAASEELPLAIAVYDSLRAQFEVSAEAQSDDADIWDGDMWAQAVIAAASGALAAGSAIVGGRRLVQYGVLTAVDSMREVLDQPPEPDSAPDA